MQNTDIFHGVDIDTKEDSVLTNVEFEQFSSHDIAKPSLYI